MDNQKACIQAMSGSPLVGMETMYKFEQDLVNFLSSQKEEGRFKNPPLDGSLQSIIFIEG